MHCASLLGQGVYQVKMAKSYIREHLKPSYLDNDELIFEVQCDVRYPHLIRVQFQSRHSKTKTYNTTVRFDSHAQQSIEGWYCTCSTGPRKIGCCTHIAALLWHLGVNRAQISEPHSCSASHLLDYVEDSNTYEKFQESDEDDNDTLYTLDSDDGMDFNN